MINFDIEKYNIKSNRNEFIIKRWWIDKKGVKQFENIGAHIYDLEEAMKYIQQRMVKESNAISLQEVLNEMKKFRTMIKEEFEKIGF